MNWTEFMLVILFLGGSLVIWLLGLPVYALGWYALFLLALAFGLR